MKSDKNIVMKFSHRLLRHLLEFPSKTASHDRTDQRNPREKDDWENDVVYDIYIVLGWGVAI